MRLLLTSSGKNTSIHDVLLDRLGKPTAGGIRTTRIAGGDDAIEQRSFKQSVTMRRDVIRDARETSSC